MTADLVTRLRKGATYLRGIHTQALWNVVGNADDCEEAADEIERLRQRCKEHEQFSHQHRDCDRMGIAIHQARLILNAVQSPADVSGEESK